MINLDMRESGSKSKEEVVVVLILIWTIYLVSSSVAVEEEEGQEVDSISKVVLEEASVGDNNNKESLNMKIYLKIQM